MAAVFVNQDALRAEAVFRYPRVSSISVDLRNDLLRIHGPGVELVS